MKSYILLENIEIYAHHGVSRQEAIVGNNFLINIRIKAEMSSAIFTDNLTDTLNYAEIYEIIKTEMDIPSKLLEHAGGRIVKALKNKFAEIEEIELKISKKNPPIEGQIEFASVILID